MLGALDLKAIAARKLENQLKQWNSEEFIRCVQEVYDKTSKTDLDIRNMLIYAATSNMAEVMKFGSFCKEFERYGEFTSPLILNFHSHSAKVFEEMTSSHTAELQKVKKETKEESQSLFLKISHEKPLERPCTASQANK
ncbi:Protein of unknown function [Pyronema omphalodes CBS 100304]|uniref:Uncharacterized protein n=1 Tax=Pyronema omphalodes (strain CBS 100304) TaxID=1076935 RepID=U4L2J4_PYROM|nr:Protein of unknown function [Pyronema omphalodes CBS 100304]